MLVLCASPFIGLVVSQTTLLALACRRFDHTPTFCVGRCCRWLVGLCRSLHKKGVKSETAKYRPVSLTCVICKILESFIRDHVMAVSYTHLTLPTNREV